MEMNEQQSIAAGIVLAIVVTILLLALAYEVPLPTVAEAVDAILAEHPECESHIQVQVEVEGEVTSYFIVCESAGVKTLVEVKVPEPTVGYPSGISW